MTLPTAERAEESMNHDRAQIFEVSTLYGAATLAAALDAGAFGPRTGTRRILLVSNNAPVPETVVQLSDMHGYQRIVTRFDEVVSWNEVIHPHRPSKWAPLEDELHLAAAVPALLGPG